MAREIAVFGYGSLLFQPELPDDVLEAVPVVLDGHRRCFNKRSRARGCPLDASAWPELGVPPAFRTGEWCWSLALGTKPSSDWIEGLMLRYPGSCADEVIRRLDEREGVRGDGRGGYLRREVEVRAGRRRFPAITYLSNPAGPYHAPGLPLSQQAAILLRATPPGGEVRGVRYATGVRNALRERGLCDPGLEALFAEIRRQAGGIPDQLVA